MEGAEIRHRILGTGVYEKYWRERRPEAPAAENEELSSAHRAWVARTLARLTPFHTLLEVGCGAGFNLEVLAKVLPGRGFTGIYINPTAVETGRSWLARHDVDGVELRIGIADDLSGIEDDAFDVVMTNATLLYIGPDKISRVFDELQRVCKRDLILVEFHDPSMPGANAWQGRHTCDGWVRNYQTLLLRSNRRAELTEQRVPPEIRSAGRWPQHGHLVHARFAQSSST